MIPVALAKEPRSFDDRVRQPGLSAIDEMVGRSPRRPHPGRRRNRIASAESSIPAERFPPYWRRALRNMMKRYEQRCAYLAMHIEWTGLPTVDHVVPKSLDWTLVYEWSNYRLCAAIVNAKKGDLLTIVDPTEVATGWFELELASARVVRGSAAPKAQHKRIDATLEILNLRDCCRQRGAYILEYGKGPNNGGIDLAYLTRRAPFIAAELRRQGKLTRGDL